VLQSMYHWRVLDRRQRNSADPYIQKQLSV
jgi:hypothetical protein